MSGYAVLGTRVVHPDKSDMSRPRINYSPGVQVLAYPRNIVERCTFICVYPFFSVPLHANDNLSLCVSNLVATIPYIRLKFDDFNRLYFNNQLPPIPIKLSNAKTFLGKVCFRKERRLFSRKWRYSDFVLRINTRIDLPEEVLEDTILHEMIHYFIAFNQWQDTSAHGRLFREQMARINATGRHIRISHRLTADQREQAQGRPKSRVVCVAYFKDGRIGIKVVPKQARHILRFHRAALAYFPIDRLEWYLSADPLFAAYPSSATLRFYLFSTPESNRNLTAALQNARPVLCDGRQLTTNH